MIKPEKILFSDDFRIFYFCYPEKIDMFSFGVKSLALEKISTWEHEAYACCFIWNNFCFVCTENEVLC